MGLGRVEEDKKEEENSRVVQIVKSAIQPIVVAHKEYYRTYPRKSLELAFLVLYGGFTLIGELIRRLPWGWYAVFVILILGYFSDILYDKSEIKNHSPADKDNPD